MYALNTALGSIPNNYLTFCLFVAIWLFVAHLEMPLPMNCSSQDIEGKRSFSMSSVEGF